MQVVSAAEARELLAEPSTKSRFNAKRVKDDGYVFASQEEHKRYCELKVLERAGHIHELTVHPDYILSVNGVDLGKVIFDFEYITAKGRVIEDVKAPHTNTPISRWKRAHFAAQYGVEVVLI